MMTTDKQLQLLLYNKINPELGLIPQEEYCQNSKK